MQSPYYLFILSFFVGLAYADTQADTPAVQVNVTSSYCKLQFHLDGCKGESEPFAEVVDGTDCSNLHGGNESTVNVTACGSTEDGQDEAWTLITKTQINGDNAMIDFTNLPGQRAWYIIALTDGAIGIEIPEGSASFSPVAYTALSPSSSIPYRPSTSTLGGTSIGIGNSPSSSTPLMTSPLTTSTPAPMTSTSGSTTREVSASPKSPSSVDPVSTSPSSC